MAKQQELEDRIAKLEKENSALGTQAKTIKVVGAAAIACLAGAWGITSLIQIPTAVHDAAILSAKEAAKDAAAKQVRDDIIAEAKRAAQSEVEKIASEKGSQLLDVSSKRIDSVQRTVNALKSVLIELIVDGRGQADDPSINGGTLPASVQSFNNLMRHMFYHKDFETLKSLPPESQPSK